MLFDRRHAPARSIFVRRGEVDVLTCGHGMGPCKDDDADAAKRRRACRRVIRRCWKCRAGYPREFVVTAQMLREARAKARAEVLHA